MHETDTRPRSVFADIRQLRAAERIGFAVLFVLLVGFTTVSAYFQWQSILRDKKSYIELVGQSKIGQFKSWYDTQMAEAKELSESSVFIDIVADAVENPSSKNLGRIDSFLRPILRSYNYADSAVLTPDLRLLASLTQLAKADCPEVYEKNLPKKATRPFLYDAPPHDSPREAWISPHNPPLQRQTKATVCLPGPDILCRRLPVSHADPVARQRKNRGDAPA